jgi:mannose/cellobiose epimerase-like protein (N-acyl-D-glucosamine 2-epimerase family)
MRHTLPDTDLSTRVTPLFDPADPRTLRPWLLEHLCPFWRERILDPAGGFFEALDGNGRPVLDNRRTTLTQARLTYVFSHAYMLGGDPSFRAAAQHGVAFLMRAARAPDGGWFHAVSVDGATLDNARDAYDHAFVLFALAWYYRATQDQSVIQLADATWGFMQHRLADTVHGGFLEVYAPGRPGMKLPRRQNPHMHLVEALLALHMATGEKNWLRRAGTLIELFKTRFVDPATGALVEFFGEDWRVAPTADGELREPGHQFEWVWLLYEYSRAARDVSIVSYAERLFAFGSQFGIERGETLPGAVFDGVDASGALTADAKLLWPQTEYLKACVARAEWVGDEVARSAIGKHLALIAQSYMRADGATWHNQLARDGSPVVKPTLARLLYHLFLAFAEADRLFAK